MKTLASQPDLEEIRRRLATLTPGDQRKWGRMSAHETVCHLREAFLIALGERPATPIKMPLPRPVIKRLALWFPRQWPHDVPTVPELLPGGGCPNPVDFASDMEGLVRNLDRFVAASNNTTPHAIFGSMGPRDWARWGYLHTDHHLRQFGR